MSVETVFAAAAHKPPAERAEYLDQACGGDVELRRKVERLLKAHDAAAEFLESPAEPIGGTIDYAPITEKAGSRIGPYVLREHIGEGGFGQVFVADQIEPVKRKVALKVIKPGMDTREVINRFEAERQALALMDHPNIARVLDAGATDSGRPYFVMELVRGVPITEYCDKNQLAPRERLDLFVNVCHAIQHAHQKGVIHRDIKPSNVLVTSHDGRPVAKVIDFGVAKAIHQQLTERTIYTNFAQMIGTPLYMSPEQAEMSSLDIDTRSDVYSLGVLLYELLTGTTPLEKKRLAKAAYDEIRRLIREEEPPKPSTRLSSTEAIASIAAQRHSEPSKLSKLVRGDLDWITMKALEKDRTRRYETANGFAADVLRYLAGEPVMAHPPSTAYQMKKFVRRNRGQVIAVGLVLLALLAGVIGTSLGLLEARRQADIARDEAAKKELAREEEARQRGIAESRREEAERNLSFAEKGNDILGSVFAGLDPKAEYATVAELRNALGANLRKAVAELDGSAIGDPLTVAQMQHTLGVSLRGLGEAGLAVEVLEKARATRAAKLGLDHLDTLSSGNNLAMGYHSAGKLDKALPLYEEAYTRTLAKFGPDHLETLHTLNNLAGGYDATGNLDKAVLLYEESLTRAKSRLGPDHPLTLTTMHNLAGTYRHVRKADKALILLEEVFTRRKAKLGADHPETLLSMDMLAGAHRDAGHPAKALPLYEESYSRTLARLGADHPETFGSMNNLATTYWSLRRLDKSVPLFEELLPLHEKKLGRDHPNTLTTVANLGVNYRDAGRVDKALPLLENALERRRAKLGPDHPDTLESINALADGYRMADRHDKSLPLYEEAYTLTKARYGADDPSTLARLNNLATGYSFAGKPDKALPLFVEALTKQKARLGPDHPDTLMSMFNAGRLYTDAGQVDEALPLIEETLTRRKALLAPDHPDVLFSMAALAACYRTSGRPEKALPLYEEALALNKAKHGPDHPDNFWSMHNLASCYSLAGRPEKAVPLFEELLPLREKKLGRSHEDTLRTVGNLGVVYKDSGRLAEAIPLLEETHRASRKHPILRFVDTPLLNAYSKAGKPAEAARLIDDLLADARKSQPKDSPALAGRLAQAGSILLEMKGFAEAEPLLRECLTIREKQEPDAWTTLNTQSMLGAALLGQKKYADAEPLLLKGYEGMKQREKSIPPQASTRIPEALDRLIELNAASNKADEVKKWKAERAKYPLFPPSKK